jgi:hypothetical protein
LDEKMDLRVLFPVLTDPGLPKQAQLTLEDLSVALENCVFYKHPKVTSRAKGSKKDGPKAVLSKVHIENICSALESFTISHKTILPKDFAQVIHTLPVGKRYFGFPLPQSSSPDALITWRTPKGKPAKRSVLLGLQMKHWKGDVNWDDEFHKLEELSVDGLFNENRVLILLGIDINSTERTVKKHKNGATIVLGPEDLKSLFGVDLFATLIKYDGPS